MRVTADTKTQTRERILDAARKLFVCKGFETTTTRDLATAAGIASGTLFNYFPSKEALGLELLAESDGTPESPPTMDPQTCPSLEEALFEHVIGCLHGFAGLRPAVGAIVEHGLSPFSPTVGGAADRLRTEHLEAVRTLVIAHLGREPSIVAMHLYWTLYLGVLVFWSRDESPKQQDTLALLDQSTRLYVAALHGDGRSKETHHDA